MLTLLKYISSCSPFFFFLFCSVKEQILCFHFSTRGFVDTVSLAAAQLCRGAPKCSLPLSVVRNWCPLTVCENTPVLQTRQLCSRRDRTKSPLRGHAGLTSPAMRGGLSPCPESTWWHPVITSVRALRPPAGKPACPVAVWRLVSPPTQPG